MPGSLTSDDDYAAAAVPDDARTGWFSIFSATLGIATALFFAQIASIITVKYGAKQALFGLAYGYIVSAVIGALLVRRSIQTGYGINIWARTVLGYRGAGFFSLIYGVACLTYFVAEASIMGASLRSLFPAFPRPLLYVCLVFVMLPLVWSGMRVLAKFQTATLLLFAGFVACAIFRSFGVASDAGNLVGRATGGGALSFGSLLDVMGMMNGLAFIIGLVSADYARFIRRADAGMGLRFVGLVFPAFCYGVTGLLGIWFAKAMQESNPGVYFVSLLGAGGIVFACTTQLRINVGNIYSGTVAFVNAAEHIFAISISRKLVVVAFCGLATFILISGTADLLAATLNVVGMYLACFVSLLLVDQYIVRRLCGQSVTGAEVCESWRLGGLISCLAATSFGVWFGQPGIFPSLHQWATPIAVLIQIILYVVLSMRPRQVNMRALTRGVD
jgi:purine-cytosine permease-like protein